MPTKKKPDAEVTLTLPLPGMNHLGAMATTALNQVAVILANPDIAGHPEVATAANNVKAQATTLSTTMTSLGAAHVSLSTLGTQRDQEAVVLRRLHGNLETLLNLAAAGDPKAVAAWGGKVASRTPTPASTDPPINAIAKATKTSGTVEAKCKAEKGVVCYLFAMGSDPLHPEQWPAPKVSGKCRFLVSGLTVGQKAYFRIALIRRGDVQGQWSDVLEVTVR